MFSCKSFSMFLVLLATLVLVASPAISVAQSEINNDAAMGTLVSTEWLSQHLEDADLVVLDCSVLMVPSKDGRMESMSGRPAYDSGHIPTAGFADLLGPLSDTASPMGFAMPTPERFCAAMGALGVGDDSRVVLYDGYNSVWAARVWWMLRWVGFDRAAILDGGLNAWKAEARPLTTEPVTREAKELTAKVRPELIAHKDEVLAAIGDDAIAVIDAMPPPHFSGKMSMYGRPGHIPGAVNIFMMSLMNDSGRYRANDELAALNDFDQSGRIITYCGAGVAASSNAFVLTRLGFKDVAVYMGSLQEWAADPDCPLVISEP